MDNVVQPCHWGNLNYDISVEVGAVEITELVVDSGSVVEVPSSELSKLSGCSVIKVLPVSSSLCSIRFLTVASAASAASLAWRASSWLIAVEKA